jgi:hypothetical protein
MKAFFMMIDLMSWKMTLKKMWRGNEKYGLDNYKEMRREDLRQVVLSEVEGIEIEETKTAIEQGGNIRNAELIREFSEHDEANKIKSEKEQTNGPANHEEVSGEEEK